MSIQLPAQPWAEGDTFTNDATGVTYTFDGVKWLASGGDDTEINGDLQDALDLKFDKAGGDLSSGGAKLGTNRLGPVEGGANTLYEGTSYGHPQALINSGMMKEYAASMSELAQEIKDREDADAELVAWIDDIEAVLPSNAPQPVNIGAQTLKVTGSRPVGAAGEAGVMLVWKSQTGGPGNPFNELKVICPDKDAIDLNAGEIWLKQGNTIQKWDTAGGGWWTNNNVLHISATATEGDALIDGQPVELYYSDPDSFYLEVISKEESKADDQLLQDQIDSHDHSTYFLIGDWSDSEFKPHADLRALDESYMDLYDVTQKAQKLVDTQQNKRLDALEESAPSGNGLGRRFKYTDSREPNDGFFFINLNDATFSFTDLNGVVRKMTNGPDFAWNYGYKMTAWGMDGELWLAAEMRTGSNYSSTHLRLYVGTIKYDRGLVSGEEYDVTVEGYW